MGVVSTTICPTHSRALVRPAIVVDVSSAQSPASLDLDRRTKVIAGIHSAGELIQPTQSTFHVPCPAVCEMPESASIRELVRRPVRRLPLLIH